MEMEVSKAYGCYLINCSCPPPSIDHIYILVIVYRISNWFETSAKKKIENEISLYLIMIIESATMMGSFNEKPSSLQ